MNNEERACSRCEEFKSASEFYKQGSRYESLCKKCKKDSRNNRSRKNRSSTIKNPELSISKNIQISTQPKIENQTTYTSTTAFQPTSSGKVLPTALGEREQMPEYDESIFYPEQKCNELGLDSDDIADLASFFRWHLDQREKRLTNSKLKNKEQGGDNE